MNTPLRNLYASEIYPDAKETLEIFKRGEYRRVPLCMEILSDAFTPVEVLKIIKAAGKQAFYLKVLRTITSGAGSLFWDMSLKWR